MSAVKKYGITLGDTEYIVSVRKIDVDVEDIADHILGINPTVATYTGAPIKPEVLGDDFVTLNADYIVSYSDNIEVGNGSVKIDGINDYAGTVIKPFRINPADIKESIIGLDQDSYEYTGEEIRPEVLTDGVVLGRDFTVEYLDNLNPGTGSVIVRGMGNYTGTSNYTFAITSDKESIVDHIIGLDPDSYVYDGYERKPSVITDETVTEDTDFTVEFVNNIEPGTANVIIRGIGNYVGITVLDFEITPIIKQDITPHILRIEPESFVYDGEAHTPEVIDDGEVDRNVDYTVSYIDHIEPGFGTVVVTGIRAYEGEVRLGFEIIDERPSIAAHVTGINSPERVHYTGEEIRPEILTDGSIVENEDYIVDYFDNVEPGEARVIVRGINNYNGEAEYTFIIYIPKEDIVPHISALEQTEYTYIMAPIEPAVLTDGTVELGIDYIVEYEDNIEPGTGVAVVTGINEYEGESRLEFTIVDERADISDHLTGINPTTGVYSGLPIEPTVLTDGTVELDVDYTVTYENNIEPGTGTASVIVNGIGLNYRGEKIFRFSIEDERPLITTHINGIDITEATYTGEAIEPEVLTDGTVELGTDYLVNYENNVEPGEAKVIVSGIDGYRGIVEYTFTINPIVEESGEGTETPETAPSESGEPEITPSSEGSEETTEPIIEESVSEEAPIEDGEVVNEETPSEDTPVESSEDTVEETEVLSDDDPTDNEPPEDEETTGEVE